MPNFAYDIARCRAQKATAEHRAQWLCLQHLQTGKSTTEIRKSDPALYAWLYRNDRDWLMCHKPPPVEFPPSDKTRRKVQFHDLKTQLRTAAQEIRNKPGLPERVTFTKALKRAGMTSISTTRFASDKEEIDEVVDTVADFVSRRVRWAAQELNRLREEWVDWRVRRTIGLRPQTLTSAGFDPSVRLAQSPRISRHQINRA
jgi:hypothetical protein